MSKTLLRDDKQNGQNRTYEAFPVQEEKEKQFNILTIYTSEIDKAIKELKQRKKLNECYEPDYQLIVQRYTDTILDDYGWYEILKHAIRTTDKDSMGGLDEL
jgi:hypothetical protein